MKSRLINRLLYILFILLMVSILVRVYIVSAEASGSPNTTVSVGISTGDSEPIVIDSSKIVQKEEKGSEETISSDGYDVVSSNISIVPVTYSCCKKYIIDQGTLLDDFENSVVWTLNGLNASYITTDTINFKEGMRGLKLVTKNGDKVYATRKIHKNFSNTKNFAFDMYVYNATTLGYITFYLASQNHWSKYFSYTIDSPFVNGWNHFVIRKSDMNNIGGEDWNNTMITFRLTAYPVNGSDTNVTIDNFRYNVIERAKVIFNFDDGTSGDSDIVEPILSMNNQKAVSFVPIDWLNSPDYMTIDNLKKLQSAGWDISSHTVSHPNLTALDDSALVAELNNSYDWLVNNGFQKTAGFIAYPYGYWNDNVIAKTKQRYIFARGVKSGIEQHLSPGYGYNLYKLKIVDIYKGITVQSVKDKIDFAIDQGGLIILVFHRIVYSNPSESQYLSSDLQQISDYIKSRSSDIDVVTFSDYVNADINNFTPIINKVTRIYSNGTVDIITNNKYDEYMPNMLVEPSKGSIDINVNKYDNALISFNESVSDKSTDVDVYYSIGGRIVGKKYLINIYWDNGTMFQNYYMVADNKGYINYYSTGFDSKRYTKIRPLLSTTDKIPEYRKNVYKEVDLSENKDKNINLSENKDNKGNIPSMSGFNNIELIMMLMLILYIKSQKK